MKIGKKKLFGNMFERVDHVAWRDFQDRTKMSLFSGWEHHLGVLNLKHFEFDYFKQIFEETNYRANEMINMEDGIQWFGDWKKDLVNKMIGIFRGPGTQQSDPPKYINGGLPIKIHPTVHVPLIFLPHWAVKPLNLREENFADVVLMQTKHVVNRKNYKRLKRGEVVEPSSGISNKEYLELLKNGYLPQLEVALSYFKTAVSEKLMPGLIDVAERVQGYIRSRVSEIDDDLRDIASNELADANNKLREFYDFFDFVADKVDELRRAVYLVDAKIANADATDRLEIHGDPVLEVREDLALKRRVDSELDLAGLKELVVEVYEIYLELGGIIDTLDFVGAKAQFSPSRDGEF